MELVRVTKVKSILKWLNRLGRNSNFSLILPTFKVPLSYEDFKEHRGSCKFCECRIGMTKFMVMEDETCVAEEHVQYVYIEVATIGVITETAKNYDVLYSTYTNDAGSQLLDVTVPADTNIHFVFLEVEESEGQDSSSPITQLLYDWHSHKDQLRHTQLSALKEDTGAPVLATSATSNLFPTFEGLRTHLETPKSPVRYSDLNRTPGKKVLHESNVSESSAKTRTNGSHHHKHSHKSKHKHAGSKVDGEDANTKTHYTSGKTLLTSSTTQYEEEEETFDNWEVPDGFDIDSIVCRLRCSDDIYRLITPNSYQPIPFQNEYFTGQVLLMVRSHENTSSNTGRNLSDTGGDKAYYNSHPYRFRFENQKYQFEVQVQGQFKKLPRPDLGDHVFIGAEVTKNMSLGMLTRSMCNTILHLGRSINKYLHHSFGDEEGNELPHICGPMWSAIDKLIITTADEMKKGVKPPPLGQLIPETSESRKLRSKNADYLAPLALDSVYTMSFKSSNIDLANWKLMNVPLLTGTDLHSFWGNASLRMGCWLVPGPKNTEIWEGDGSNAGDSIRNSIKSKGRSNDNYNYSGLPKKHYQLNNKYLFSLDIQHVSNLPRKSQVRRKSATGDVNKNINLDATTNQNQEAADGGSPTKKSGAMSRNSHTSIISNLTEDDGMVDDSPTDSEGEEDEDIVGKGDGDAIDYAGSEKAYESSDERVHKHHRGYDSSSSGDSDSDSDTVDSTEFHDAVESVEALENSIVRQLKSRNLSLVEDDGSGKLWKENQLTNADITPLFSKDVDVQHLLDDNDDILDSKTPFREKESKTNNNFDENKVTTSLVPLPPHDVTMSPKTVNKRLSFTRQVPSSLAAVCLSSRYTHVLAVIEIDDIRRITGKYARRMLYVFATEPARTLGAPLSPYCSLRTHSEWSSTFSMYTYTDIDEDVMEKSDTSTTNGTGIVKKEGKNAFTSLLGVGKSNKPRIEGTSKTRLIHEEIRRRDLDASYAACLQNVFKDVLEAEMARQKKEEKLARNVSNGSLDADGEDYDNDRSATNSVNKGLINQKNVKSTVLKSRHSALNKISSFLADTSHTSTFLGRSTSRKEGGTKGVGSRSHRTQVLQHLNTFSGGCPVDVLKELYVCVQQGPYYWSEEYLLFTDTDLVFIKTPSPSKSQGVFSFMNSKKSKSSGDLNEGINFTQIPLNSIIYVAAVDMLKEMPFQLFDIAAISITTDYKHYTILIRDPGSSINRSYPQRDAFIEMLQRSINYARDHSFVGGYNATDSQYGHIANEELGVQRYRGNDISAIFQVPPKGYIVGDRLVLNNRANATTSTCMFKEHVAITKNSNGNDKNNLVETAQWNGLDVAYYMAAPHKLIKQLLKMIVHLTGGSTQNDCNTENDHKEGDGDGDDNDEGKDVAVSIGKSNDDEKEAWRDMDESNLAVEFMNGVTLLQDIDLKSIDPTLSTTNTFCCYLNLYHCLLLHSFWLMGVPDTANRFAECSKCAYIAFGELFDLKELEHCIIKRNVYKAENLNAANAYLKAMDNNSGSGKSVLDDALGRLSQGKDVKVVRSRFSPFHDALSGKIDRNTTYNEISVMNDDVTAMEDASSSTHLSKGGYAASIMNKHTNMNMTTGKASPTTSNASTTQSGGIMVQKLIENHKVLSGTIKQRYGIALNRGADLRILYLLNDGSAGMPTSIPIYEADKLEEQIHDYLCELMHKNIIIRTDYNDTITGTGTIFASKKSKEQNAFVRNVILLPQFMKANGYIKCFESNLRLLAFLAEYLSEKQRNALSQILQCSSDDRTGGFGENYIIKYYRASGATKENMRFHKLSTK